MFGTFLYALDSATAGQWLETQQDAAADRYWRNRERAVVLRLKGAATGYGRLEQFKDVGWFQLDADIAGMFGANGGATMYAELFHSKGDRMLGTYRPKVGGVIMPHIEVEIPHFILPHRRRNVQQRVRQHRRLIFGESRLLCNGRPFFQYRTGTTSSLQYEGSQL